MEKSFMVAFSQEDDFEQEKFPQKYPTRFNGSAAEITLGGEEVIFGGETVSW